MISDARISHKRARRYSSLVNMKKILIILVTVLVAYSAIFWLFIRDEFVPKSGNEVVAPEVVNTPEDVAETENTITNGKLCFSRTQVATDEAPYSAEEYIELNINENMASGTKKGTQVGPGVSNGYEGSLSGEIVNEVIGVIFSYVIEGSAGKEKEEYILRNGDLIKQRYPLVEENDILVPDKDGEMSEIVYQSAVCE
jgi:hypothetical protein